jgi:hypothetical protein
MVDNPTVRVRRVDDEPHPDDGSVSSWTGCGPAACPKPLPGWTNGIQQCVDVRYLESEVGHRRRDHADEIGRASRSPTVGKHLNEVVTDEGRSMNSAARSRGVRLLIAPITARTTLIVSS